MAATPDHKKLLAIAATAREDQLQADQYQGALEILLERVPDDAVVLADLPKCRAFLRLLYELRQAVAPLAAAVEKGDPPPADFDPSLAQRLIPQWETTRAAFQRDYREHKDYLEKLALRFVR
jgi:hypothetical protein